MPETLQQLKVRIAREIKQRTAARIARLRGEEESSDEDPDKDEKKERKVRVRGCSGLQCYPFYFFFFVACFIVLLLVANLFYLQQLLLER